MKKSELNRENFSERLKKALAINGKDGWGSGSYLKKITNVTQKAANKWLNGESIPNKEKIIAISRELGINSSWLEYGEGEVSSNIPLSNNKSSTHSLGFANPENQKSYPLLSWSELGELNKDIGLLPHDIKREYLMTSTKAGNNSFWLDVKNDSMISESGIGVPQGAKILVDPDLKPKKNQYIAVINVRNPSEYSFRMYAEDAGIEYIKPLNKSYRMQELGSEWKIIGTVIEAKIELI